MLNFTQQKHMIAGFLLILFSVCFSVEAAKPLPFSLLSNDNAQLNEKIILSKSVFRNYKVSRKDIENGLWLGKIRSDIDLGEIKRGK